MSTERTPRTTERTDARAARVATKQHGLIRREQARALGVTNGAIHARIRAGRWEAVFPSVFRIAGQPATWQQMLLGACFTCGSDAVASHRAAAALWSLPGFPEGPIEVTASSQRGRKSTTIRLHRARIDPHDRTARERIPVTTPARTLLDLAATVPLPLLEEALDDAIRRRLVRIDRMRARIEETRTRGRRGVRSLEQLLESRTTGGVPQSVFETRLLRLIRTGGLPDPAVQHPIRLGTKMAVTDFAYPNLQLAIEADGYRWHAGRSSWEHDLARRNALTAKGWRVLHLTWSDVARRPAQTLDRIREAMEASRSRVEPRVNMREDHSEKPR